MLPTPPEAIGVVSRRDNSDCLLQLRRKHHIPSQVNISIDDRRYTGLLEAQPEVGGRHGGGLGPAFGSSKSVAGIDTDGDPPGKFLAGFDHQGGVLGGGAAQDHATDAGVEPGGDPRKVPDAAAKLHRDRDIGQIERTATALTGLPAKAPLRSTTCSQENPAACHAFA